MDIRCVWAGNAGDDRATYTRPKQAEHLATVSSANDVIMVKRYMTAYQSMLDREDLMK